MKMSTKGTRKNAAKGKPKEIVTRKKTAQQNKQNRGKTKKEKQSPKQPVTVTEPEIIPEKSTKIETHVKDTPLKNKVKDLVKLVEQVEYYPDKLKRDLSVKKILLKAKPNFKVVASANKRKMGVPQKGGTNPSPTKKHCNSTKTKNSTELSMADLVRIMEDTQTLSEEDFMEILTCPSPVWWEDPPDDEYIEDAIDLRTPDPSPLTIDLEDDSPKPEHSRTSTPTNKRTKNNNTLVDFESQMEEFKISPKNEKFRQKKQKLEHVLGNIKKCENKSPVKQVKINKNTTKRRISNSTDGELSDLSFNEEEILKNLENMEIPIETNCEQNKTNEQSDCKSHKTVTSVVKTEEITIKDELIVPTVLPPLTKKPVFKEIKSESTDSCSDHSVDSVSNSNFRFISDDDISSGNTEIADKNIGVKSVNVDSSNLGENSSFAFVDVDSLECQDYEIKKEQINSTVASEKNDELIKKVNNDLSEYITVYKIMSNDSPEKNGNKKNCIKKRSNNKRDKIRGKLNNFFKKCKNNKRLKKSDSSFPANTVTDVKDLKENTDKTTAGNEENRLKSCDSCCTMKIENGDKEFSCEKCAKNATFPCNLCNFNADSNEMCKKQTSSCKDVARIIWNNSYLINQT